MSYGFFKYFKTMVALPWGVRNEIAAGMPLNEFGFKLLLLVDPRG